MFLNREIGFRHFRRIFTEFYKVYVKILDQFQIFRLPNSMGLSQNHWKTKGFLHLALVRKNKTHDFQKSLKTIGKSNVFAHLSITKPGCQKKTSPGCCMDHVKPSEKQWIRTSGTSRLAVGWGNCQNT